MEFFPFFLVLLATVFFSELFRRLHLPWVVALILGGIVIGPSALGLFETGETMSFLGQIGLIFLMFTAGLEIRLSGFISQWREISTITLLNSMIPFVVGFSIAGWFGMGLQASILLGIIFISSAVAVAIPSLETNRLMSSKPGRLVTPVAVIQDISSLILLAVFLQVMQIDASLEGGELPVWLFFILLVISVVVLRLIVPKVQWFFSLNSKENKVFEQDVRTVFTILIGTVVIFQLIGLHPMVGGFFAGVILSDSVTHPALKEKIRTISYGLFIPIFFIVVGVNTDIGVFREMGAAVLLILLVVGGSMTAKFLSGWTGARLVGFSRLESTLIGAATMPHLSITLAVAFTGVELGILTENLATALVILTIVTTFTVPLLIKAIAKRMDRTVV